MRVDRGYVGALRSGLEKLLQSYGVQFRSSSNSGRIRYDINGSPSVSILITDFGVVASQTPGVVDLYIKWLDKRDRVSLLASSFYRNVGSRSRKSNELVNLYLDSNFLFFNLWAGSYNPQGSLNAPTSHGLSGYIGKLPRWSLTAWAKIDKGLLFSSSFSFAEKSPHTEKFLTAINKPISNHALKFLPNNVVFLGTTNLAGVWEIIKDDLQQIIPQDKQSALVRASEFFQGEALIALIPDGQGQLGWFDGYVVGLQQKEPLSFVKFLDDTFPEIKGLRQSTRYQNQEIACYPGVFGLTPCFTEVESFVFIALSKERIERMLAARSAKSGGFQEVIKSDERLKKIFVGENHGLLYANLNEIGKLVDVLPEIGAAPQLKKTLQGTSKPFYLAGATRLTGEVFKTEAFLSVDLSDLEEPVLEFAKGIIVRVALMQRGGTAASTGPMVGVSKPTGKPADLWIRGLAEHLARTNGKLYCAYWAPHCQDQKEMFGNSGNRLPYVECSPSGPRGPQAPECQVAGIKAYPTWIVNGRRYGGTQTLENLARYSGFKE